MRLAECPLPPARAPRLARSRPPCHCSRREPGSARQRERLPVQRRRISLFRAPLARRLLGRSSLFGGFSRRRFGRRRLGDCELRFGLCNGLLAPAALRRSRLRLRQREHCQRSAALRRSAARPSASCPARRRPRRLRQPHRRGHGGDGDGVRLRAVPRRRLVPALQRLALPRLRAQALRSRRSRRPRGDRHPRGVHARDPRACGDDACGPGARPPTRPRAARLLLVFLALGFIVRFELFEIRRRLRRSMTGAGCRGTATGRGPELSTVIRAPSKLSSISTSIMTP